MSAADRPGVWERLWFSAEDPATLTFVRWLVFSSVAVNAWVGRHASRGFPDRPDNLWDPISLLAAVRLPQPSPLLIEVLLLTVGLGCALTLLRIWPRVTGLAAAGSYLVLVLMENSFGKISHGKQPLVVMALVLAIASVPSASAPRSWRWHWPVQLCRTVLGVTLAAAAFSKLQRSGLEWVFSETMRNVLVMESTVLREPALEGLARWIASEPWRWKAAAAGALAGEASLIWAVALPSSRVRSALVVAGAGTVAGITLLMDLVGFPIVLLCAVFISPRTAIDALARGCSALRTLGPPLVGMALLAGVLMLRAGRPTALTALPLAIGAVVLVVTTRRRRPAAAPGASPAASSRRVLLPSAAAAASPAGSVLASRASRSSGAGR